MKIGKKVRELLTRVKANPRFQTIRRHWSPDLIDPKGMAAWSLAGAGLNTLVPRKDNDQPAWLRALMGAAGGGVGYGGAVLGNRGLRAILEKFKYGRRVSPGVAGYLGGTLGSAGAIYAGGRAGEKAVDKIEEKIGAFKLGFQMKLAEEGLSPSQLFDELEKVAAKATPVPVAPRPGASPLGVGTALATGGTLGLVGGMAVPRLVGTSAGNLVATMSDAEVDNLPQAKKKYLIKKLKRLIREMKIKKQNRLVSQVKQEVPA